MVFSCIAFAIIFAPERIDSFFWAGVPCAFTWVAAAYLVAPRWKLTVAFISWVLGAAWATLIVIELPDTLISYCATLASGLAAVALGMYLEARKVGGLGKAVPWLSNLLKQIRAGLVVKKNGRSDNERKEDGTMSDDNQKNISDVLGGIANIMKTNKLAGLAVTLIAAMIVIKILLALASSFVDIIQQNERGLYLRLGKYSRTVEPGMVFKIPMVDQVIRVDIKERQGYIQHVDAMTQDSVIMKVSLQYTYDVVNPRIYRLDILNSDNIIREFVQGKLRDIVNTTPMTDVMMKRGAMNRRIAEELKEMEPSYGIRFKLVQIQGTYPPDEVQTAIKQRMIMEERTVEAKEQAAQKKIIADAQLYETRKKTEAEKNRIEQVAKARRESISLILGELAKNEKLGEKYLSYMMAQELKTNSKWIISGDSAPELHIRDDGNK